MDSEPRFDSSIEELKGTIFKHFFDEKDEPIKTLSQYHLETMWDHINMVYDEFTESLPNFSEFLDDHAKKVTHWGVKLHDIAKPDTITEKYRKICERCYRPNSHRNTHCYQCKQKLPIDIVLQHGWHGHEIVGGSKEYLFPILDKIGIKDDLSREEIRLMVRWHSLVHAMLHVDFSTTRGANEAESILYKADELGFNPLEMTFQDFMKNLFPDSSRNVRVGAVLLSRADELGKISDIYDEFLCEDRMMEAIYCLSLE